MFTYLAYFFCDATCSSVELVNIVLGLVNIVKDCQWKTASSIVRTLLFNALITQQVDTRSVRMRETSNGEQDAEVSDSRGDVDPLSPKRNAGSQF